MHLYYVLNPFTHEVIPVDNVYDWAAFFETSDRTVQKTYFDEVMISTVFLGLDHSLGNSGPPLVFETMIFGGPLNDRQWRYSTWDEAVAFHALAVAKAKHAHTPWNRAKAFIYNSKFWRDLRWWWLRLKYNIKEMTWENVKKKLRLGR